MEKLEYRECRWPALVVMALVAAFCPYQLPASSPAEQALLTKAQSLAAHGHLEMAVQTWEQVLLSDPENKEALAGIARAEMQLGKPGEAEKYLDRLRALGGDTSAVAQIASMPRMQPPAVRLAEARRLALAGKYDEAMHIYRDVYGDEPPAGDAALAYYDTEAAIPESRQHAVEGLRRLAQQFPADSRYAITLGRVLTYDPKTRGEGITLLKQYSSNAAAQDALNQAETWNEKAATQGPTVAAGKSAGAMNAPELLAYRALNSGHLDEAKRRFQDLLAREPDNSGALSGMGYVLMKEKDFAAAEGYLERAQTAGAKGVESGLTLSRFWLRMSKGDEELKKGDSDSAVEDYRGAMNLEPSRPEALEALAGALLQKGDAQEASGLFERTLSVAPDRMLSWRGLFQAQSAMGDAQAALATYDRMPPDIRAQVDNDPDFLRALAEDDLTQGRKADFDRVVQQAMALPFPDQGRGMPPDRQMQYAALLMSVHRYKAALQLYRQVIDVQPDNIAAWRSVIALQHQLDRDAEALATIGRMPQNVFKQVDQDPGFLAIVGSIYQTQHDLVKAREYLERAAASSNPPALALELQLADVYAALGKLQEAYSIYRREAADHPEDLAAWRGLLGVLHQSGHDRDGIRVLATIPESTRLRLASDPSYLQALASIQIAVGQDRSALKTFDQLSAVYADQNMVEPIDTQIQYGWALLNVGDDRKLYAVISNLSNAPDLTDIQQTGLSRLLAAWSVRRANAAAAVGDLRRSITVLQAAARAVPGNADVLNSLAGAYLKAGEARRAVAIYESLDMDNASSGQYQGAIGAALAAGDMKHAAAWLQNALDRYRGNATILKMAAEYEQAVGNNDRAVAYYRAALAAMGPESAAGALSRPGGGDDGSGDPQSEDSPTRDLMNLLAPQGRMAMSDSLGGTEDGPGQANRAGRDTLTSSAPTLGDFAESGQSDLNNTLPRARDDESFTGRRSDLALSANPLDRNAQREPPKQLSQAEPNNETRDGAAAVQLQAAARALAGENDILAASSAKPEDNPAGIAPPAGRRHHPAHSLLARGKSHPTPAGSYANGREDDLAMTAPRTGSAQDPSKLDDAGDESATMQNSDALPAITINSKALHGEAASENSQNGAATPTLPPLTGPATPVQQQKSPREEINNQLELIEGASSGWLGGTSAIGYRSGQPGYDRLSTYSAQAEESGMLGPSTRITLITQPVLLDAGSATGAETLRQGTLSATAIPTTQSASGLANELQIRTTSFAAALGTTPRGFLIANVTGGLYVHPPSGHFTLTFSREPILDTQLSYAGLRDEGSAGPTYQGNVWGGVIANGGEVQVASGGSRSGWYLQGGGQYITGIHVPTNSRFDGDFGAYWSIWRHPEYGSMTVGMNFFAMHYARNLRYFTYGQGGYFSPDAYVVAGVPVTFSGHYQQRFHYRVTGSLGLQAFNEESSEFFPLDPALQTAEGNLSYPAATNVGGNYNFVGEGSYAIADHWYTGGFMEFNNTRDYASSKIGFFVRYLFRQQPLGDESGPNGLFPTSSYRPLRVP